MQRLLHSLGLIHDVFEPDHSPRLMFPIGQPVFIAVRVHYSQWIFVNRIVNVVHSHSVACSHCVCVAVAVAELIF